MTTNSDDSDRVRPAFGRPVNSGRFGERTKVVRIPISRLRDVDRLLASNVGPILRPAEPATRIELPMMLSPAPQLGFPSPAADYVEDVLDLNDLLITNPPATFFARGKGASMIDIGIFDGDVLVINRAIDPSPGLTVLAVVDGDFFVKQLGALDGRPALLSRNSAKAADYPPIFLDNERDHSFFGVVTDSIHKLGRP